VEPIRVLLAGPPTLQDAFGRALVEANDIEVAAAAPDPIELLLATARTRADVVVIGMKGDELPGVVSHLLAEYPHLKVLGVAQDARRAVLCELHPRLVPLGELSPGGLLEAIRAAVRAEVGE
jgi:DNA-binding NarL/FixJ family response regulator